MKRHKREAKKANKRVARLVKDAKEEKEADRIAIGVVRGFAKEKGEREHESTGAPEGSGGSGG